MIVVRLFSQEIKKRNKINIVSIIPSADLGSILDLTPERSIRNMQLGYLDTLKAFRKLEGNTYYIKPDSRYDEDFFFKIIIGINEDTIAKISDKLGMHSGSNIRCLLEKIIPHLGETLKLRNNFTYKEFILALVEKRMEEIGVDRMKIYQYEEVVGFVVRSFNKANRQSLITVEKNEINNILSNRNKIIKSIYNKILMDINASLIIGMG